MATAPKPFTTPSSLKGPRAMEVLDEAVSLLRRAPLSLLSLYYLGALPCCLTFTYIYFDMTQGALAEKHLPAEALVFTASYFWMKTCQAVFARKLVALLEGEDPEPWTLRRWANTALLQTIFAGSFPIVYPLAILITIPFGWISAFYHNISIVATSAKSTVRSSLAEAMKLSYLWPKQNHLILAILLAALLFLFANLWAFFSMIPELLNMFFGVSTVFDENGSALSNSSFYLDVFVFCFLILNPLNKAIYALRCFYGRSRLSGADLKAELRRQNFSRREQGPVRVLAMVVFIAVTALAWPVRADVTATPSPTPAIAQHNVSKIDTAIQKTLQKDEFAWRMPRQETDQPQKDGIIVRTLRSILKFLNHALDKLFKPIRKFLKWLFDSDNSHKHDSADSALTMLGSVPWRLVFLLVLGIVVACLVFLLARHFQNRKAHPLATLASVPTRTVDLEAEDVRADELPEDSWLALARDLMQKGELRLALRALYLATLSVLARGQLVRLAPGKSNRDYLVELTRRLRGNAGAVTPFRENITLFEASWYGTHAVDSAILDTMLANHQQVRSHATA